MLDALGPTPLDQLTQGRHACLVYTSPEDAIAAAAPYAAAGLRNGERCVYVLGLHDPALVRRTFAAAGIDVEAAEARGALVFVSEWDVSFPGGEFDPVAMIDYVRSTIAATTADGFRGLRVLAEMSWALELGVGHDRLIHYEAIGNRLYPHEPLVALCMYDAHRFPAEVCRDALRCHPVVSTGGDASENVFYEPPEALLAPEPVETRLAWMLDQLDRVREDERRRGEVLRLRAAVDAKDELLRLLAHELRTPLTATLATVQGALRRLERSGGPDADLKRELDRIGRQARKQGLLIEQVVHAAQADDAMLPLAPTRVELVALVREAAEVAAANTRRTVSVTAPDTIEVLGDALRLEQVMTNVLDNALKFSGPATGVEVVLSSGHGLVEVAVRDHGIGIPEEHRTRIFERYVRLAEGYTGLGLGLHLCRDMVRRHGGDMSVDCPPEGGTTMTVRLPLAPERVSTVEPRAAAAG